MYIFVYNIWNIDVLNYFRDLGIILLKKEFKLIFYINFIFFYFRKELGFMLGVFLYYVKKFC